MTPQEQQMIDGLIGRIRNTPVPSKDPEAEQHIQQSLSGFPDALYVLVQTVLVQGYGLQQAQSQINELKQQRDVLQGQVEQSAGQAKSSGGGFLSHIFGGGSSTPISPPPTSQYQPVTNPGYGAQGVPAAPPPPPPGYPPQGYPQAYPQQGYPAGGGGMFGGGGSGGFLQGAMQTAAGVAAGEMMFQGMEDLFHGFGHSGGERGFGMPGGGETVVNNYYDGDRAGDRDTGDRGRDDSGFYNPDRDASRSDAADLGQGGSDGGSFGGNAMDFTGSDAGSNDLSFENSAADDSGFDNSGGGDAGFDDSSSGDFSSGDNS